MSTQTIQTIGDVIATLEAQLNQSQLERTALLNHGTGFGSISYERMTYEREDKIREAICYLRNGGVFPFPDVMPQQRITLIDNELARGELEDSSRQRLWQERDYLAEGGAYPLINVSVAKRVFAAHQDQQNQVQQPRESLWGKIKSLVLGA